MEYADPNTVKQTKVTISQNIPPPPNVIKRELLTSKNALKFLLEGNLKSKVCRYCLNIVPHLSELDQILQVANKGALYKVSIKDMLASFHPFKVTNDPNLPDKICDKCLDRTISSYLFTQQCEQAERAIHNCFNDIYEKFEKLDPLEKPKHKRGRQKLNPNHNIIYVEHDKVIDYADPIIHIVNTVSESLTTQPKINEFECLKCCEVLPNLTSLLNHAKIHPKSMWFNCRLCGKSFPKHHHLKKHWHCEHLSKNAPKTSEKEITKYNCKRCGMEHEKYYEHLQHLEKHKFKMVMEHLVERNMDKLCAVCLNKESDMVLLDKKIYLHGGCPELTGDRPLYNILDSTLPEMNILGNYTGTKICEKCLSHAITSFVFINQTYFVRNRLSTCVSVMLENLDKIIEIDKNICIEIAQNAIMNIVEPFDDNVIPEEKIDELNMKEEFLEDEFRLKSEDESELENDISNLKQEALDNSNNKEDTLLYEKNEPHNEISKLKRDGLVALDTSNTSHIYMNGYMLENSDNTEFLNFNKKAKISKPKFICPLCNKQFISDYFLKRHIVKHKPKKVKCNICNFQFKSKFDLYEHKKMTHLLNKSIFLSCKICGRCYINEEKLKYHVKHHKNRICQLCDKRFKSERCYNSHMHRHMRKLGIIMRKYTQTCRFCEKDCPNDNEFLLHVNKAHLQIKPYSCDMCEQYFYTEYNLKSHKKVHSVYRKEQCNLCDKILKSRKLLAFHIRKHIGDKPFSCQICFESFYSEYRLKKHMNVIHGGRLFCKYCKTTFLTKKELKHHLCIAHNSMF